ncbi:hypothetical protein LY76DRAFT_382441 [Colletotrichum caudatum]|nr:hypothetical protein LY76DRAFT_382441 [Colletotrichum caudatum]
MARIFFFFSFFSVSRPFEAGPGVTVTPPPPFSLSLNQASRFRRGQKSNGQVNDTMTFPRLANLIHKKGKERGADGIVSRSRSNWFITARFVRSSARTHARTHARTAPLSIGCPPTGVEASTELS